MKPEKPSGPPPFESPTAAKFESNGALRGLQISLKLCNVCAFQDRIFVVLFGNMPPDAAAGAAAANAAANVADAALSAMQTAAAAIGGSSSSAVSHHNPDIQTVFGSTGSKWTQISCTEVCKCFFYIRGLFCFVVAILAMLDDLLES
jgi:hypothetical protein